ncbi:hypothetical protein FOZ60_009180 [Perkinsus olseni]|uniref:Uncharacterized protein n=1 Tax=Perkinsus olseni TaxID=32597 RepID=A0A7J6PD65_PEROL|nr:hypothetical protein FOZ60_009180 [Perkinsus olseni]
MVELADYKELRTAQSTDRYAAGKQIYRSANVFDKSWRKRTFEHARRKGRLLCSELQQDNLCVAALLSLAQTSIQSVYSSERVGTVI